MKIQAPVTLPLTLGLDVAGVVDQVGPGVDAFHLGDAVFAKTVAGQGGYVEYTVINASQAALKPKCLSFVEAAAIPTAGLTAWQALFDTADLQRGQTVLIHAAAGGVGSSPCSSPNGRAPVPSGRHPAITCNSS